MPSGGRGAAATIPEEPVRAARRHYRNLIPHAQLTAVQLKSILSQPLCWRHLPCVIWGPATEEMLQFEIVEVEESQASSLPMAATYADSSTSLDEAIIGHFCSRLRTVFDLGAGEAFEDGMETDFSEALIERVAAGRSSAVDALRRLIDQGYAGHEVGGEALRWLGCVDQPATRNVRRMALERYLQSDSAYLQDGAAIGLSEMDDPAALPAIEVAMSSEAGPLMLKRFKQVREQLEATRSCHTSPEW